MAYNTHSLPKDLLAEKAMRSWVNQQPVSCHAVAQCLPFPFSLLTVTTATTKAEDPAVPLPDSACPDGSGTQLCQAATTSLGGKEEESRVSDMMLNTDLPFTSTAAVFGACFP